MEGGYGDCSLEPRTSSPVSRRDSVVLVHGLWMRGHEMFLLRRRLRRCRFHVIRFSYPSRRWDLAEAARHLQQLLRQMPSADTVHFVGHSLGGLVIRRLFHDFPEQPPGRVVTLGTPHDGSRVGRFLAANPLGRRLLGKSLTAFTADGMPWDGRRDLGVIAGGLSFGVGRFLADMPRPNDGTVAVAETRLPGMRDHIVLPVSHMGLVVAPGAARQTCYFLRRGVFLREGEGNEPDA